ncbi:MAG: fdrA domain protein [Chloroflexi bacterium]|nr:fdrA domain protein [Chloroflexota bacterium]
METKLDELLNHPPIIINIGVQDFAAALETQGAQVIHLDWSPPAGGDQEMLSLLDKLL